MNETPQPPGPAPKVPSALLWISVSAPSLIICVLSLSVRFVMKSDPETHILPTLLIGPFIFPVIAIFLALFHDVAARRYRGPSLEYLCAAYFLGQVIVCSAIWLGFCLPILRLT